MTPVSGLLAEVGEFYGQDRPARLGVAVSGGSDSLALLYLLRDWGEAEIAVVTVNHALRPEAADEARHVSQVCAGLGVPHSVLDWGGWDGTGNLQAEARRVRYALIAGWARDRGLDAVALGHTRDDVAETFLMRLSREAGVRGLAAMRPRFQRAGCWFHRPLLACARAELQADLAAREVRWIDDPSNEDADFERVRARQTLALLSPLGIEADGLARVAGHLADADRALSEVAARWVAANACCTAGDLIFDRPALLDLPGDLRRRILAAGFQWVSSSDYPPRRRTLDGALKAVAETGDVTLHGCRLTVREDDARIAREHAAVADTRTATDRIWDGRWRVEGPHAPDLEIRALGEALAACPDWRATGLPRASLLATPSIWRGESLVSAPLAGWHNGWSAETGDLDRFANYLISH